MPADVRPAWLTDAFSVTDPASANATRLEPYRTCTVTDADRSAPPNIDAGSDCAHSPSPLIAFGCAHVYVCAGAPLPKASTMRTCRLERETRGSPLESVSAYATRRSLRST